MVFLMIQPKNNSLDPFTSKSMVHHPTAYQLVQFLQSSFSYDNFRAEALGTPTPDLSGSFRHKAAVADRLRDALQEDMLMLSTLALASGAMGWRFGVRHQDLPPEYFIQRGCRAVRQRLQQSNEVDNNLIRSIYGLAAAEMWVGNFDAASTHFTVLRNIIHQSGGTANLNVLTMESVILGGK